MNEEIQVKHNTQIDYSRFVSKFKYHPRKGREYNDEYNSANKVNNGVF